MHPFLLLLLAITSPILLAIALLVPLYAGIAGAAYIIYAHGAAVHPLTGHMLDVFYIIDVYSNLFRQWAGHIDETNLLTYSAPLIGLPVFGLFLALWFTATLARGLKNLFQHGAVV